MILAQQLQVKIEDKRYGREWELPRYATEASAGLDLRAALDDVLTLAPNKVALIPTGLSIYIADPTLCGMILPRSGLGHRHGIILGNGVGLIDADYQGQLQISLWNRESLVFQIQPGDRVAQFVVVPIVRVNLHIVESFDDTIRGSGGFGHSGIR